MGGHETGGLEQNWGTCALRPWPKTTTDGLYSFNFYVVEQKHNELKKCSLGFRSSLQSSERNCCVFTSVIMLLDRSHHSQSQLPIKRYDSALVLAINELLAIEHPRRRHDYN